MTPHVERMIVEHEELIVKVNALASFIETSATFLELPEDERVRMSVQLLHMRAYENTLGARIDAARVEESK